jgi:tRNA threonylcarbamoyladenosine biosynthesis protein TsaE
MIIDTLEDTKALATQLAARLKPGDVVFLKGPLGAGKTTLVRYVLYALGVKGTVKSPTYTLIEEYDALSMDVYHMDLYRLNDPFELEEMGCREYFHEKALCFIEWPEKAAGSLPAPDFVITLHCDDEIRNIKIDSKDVQREF